jgi:hypothetical protein
LLDGLRTHCNAAGHARVESRRQLSCGFVERKLLICPALERSVASVCLERVWCSALHALGVHIQALRLPRQQLVRACDRAATCGRLPSQGSGVTAAQAQALAAAGSRDVRHTKLAAGRAQLQSGVRPEFPCLAFLVRRCTAPQPNRLSGSWCCACVPQRHTTRCASAAPNEKANKHHEIDLGWYLSVNSGMPALGPSNITTRTTHICSVMGEVLAQDLGAGPVAAMGRRFVTPTLQSRHRRQERTAATRAPRCHHHLLQP